MGEEREGIGRKKENNGRSFPVHCKDEKEKQDRIMDGKRGCKEEGMGRSLTMEDKKEKEDRLRN